MFKELKKIGEKWCKEFEKEPLQAGAKALALFFLITEVWKHIEKYDKERKIIACPNCHSTNFTEHFHQEGYVPHYCCNNCDREWDK